MKNLALPIVLLISIGFHACSDSMDEEMPTDECLYDTNNLKGTVLERSFELQSARACFDVDEDEYQIQMFGADDIDITAVCTVSGIDLIGSQITFFVDNKVESQSFGGTKIVTLYHAASMDIATNTTGCYEVTAIENNTVKGRLILRNTDNTILVNGVWEAEVCDC